MKSLFNFTFYFVVPIAFLLFLFWFGWGDNLKSQGSLILKDAFLTEMGAINKNSAPIIKNFTVENIGKDNVVVSKIYTDCDCISVEVFFANNFIGQYSVPKIENEKPIGLVLSPRQNLTIKTTIDMSNITSALFSNSIFIESKNPKEILKINLRARLIR